MNYAYVCNDFIFNMIQYFFNKIFTVAIESRSRSCGLQIKTHEYEDGRSLYIPTKENSNFIIARLQTLYGVDIRETSTI